MTALPFQTKLQKNLKIYLNHSLSNILFHSKAAAARLKYVADRVFLPTYLNTINLNFLVHGT